MTLMQELANQPAPLSYWLNWMGFVNLVLPLAFIWRHTEARVVIVVFLANAIFMSVLYDSMGYGKHLGLAHVVFWTPLVLWLVTRFDGARQRSALLAAYILVVIATNTISLGIDYADVSQAFRLFG
ncbi:MAG: hypothetical protein KBA31_12420 [Alphaproteobacteria bacterium]|nr:hypothetical protein [Alphaproteobacteria bacterium]